MIFYYNDKPYPNYIKEGNAISYILPYADYFMKGKILDVGGTEDWHYPSAEFVNITNKNGYHAMKLPEKKYDSIISSHTLEHLKDPFFALKYWTEHLKKDGCLFLYLPSEEMDYWTFDNPLHLHIFTPTIIKGWLKKIGYKDILTSGQDLYYSFSVIGFKK
jgi:predicted SAM-dependent methyltransferase